jgi:hypothetical protein
VGYRAKEYAKLLDLYRSQEPRILYNYTKAYRIANEIVPNPILL